VVLDKNQMGPKNFEVAVEVNHATLQYREAQPDELHLWPEAGPALSGGEARRKRFA
jgi:hypothetical protein